MILSSKDDRAHDRPETIDQIRDALDDLRRRRSEYPELPDDKLGLWWDNRADRRPDPDTDGETWLITDTEDRIVYSTTIISLWTRLVSQQDPDVVLGLDTDAGEHE